MTTTPPPTPPPLPDRPLADLTDRGLDVVLGIAIAQYAADAPSYLPGALARVLDELTERGRYSSLMGSLGATMANWLIDAEYTDRIGLQVAQLGRSTQPRLRVVK